jgi:hypothetical protein
MSEYTKFEAERIKHMEMIQAVVARLAGNSFLFKGWAITLAGAFSGFALDSNNAWLAAAGFGSTVVFWGIDAYFLKSERLFRALYDQVRKRDAEIAPFYMAATSEWFVTRVRSEKTECDPGVASWLKTAFRGSVWAFYTVLLMGTGVVVAITLLADPSKDEPAEDSMGHLLASFANAISNVL